ncbi:MAG: acyltransferase [Prevotella nanceiensis]|nr:acyltransferase [Hoylesella nanceiensis]
MENKEYYPEITLLKGIAILLVVMGHALPSCIDQNLWYNSFACYIIGTPQMAMFFIASGFLFSESISWKDFLNKKVRRLLVPYVSYWAIVAFLHVILSSYTLSGSYSFKDSIIFLFTGGIYWFLYVLLLIMIVVRLFQFKYGYLILSAICICISFVFLDLPMSANRFFNYTPFFIAGIYIRRHYSDIKSFMSRYQMPFMIGFCLLFVVTYFVIPETLFLGKMFGTLMFAFICLYINVKNKCGRILSYFGKYSLQYYINHLLIGTVAIKIASRFVFDSSLSCYVQWLMVFSLMLLFSFVGFEIQKRLKFLRIISGL